MKENPNIVLSFLPEGISRIKLNDSSNYNALSSKNIEVNFDDLTASMKRIVVDNKIKN